jgi:hypothetical protein
MFKRATVLAVSGMLWACAPLPKDDPAACCVARLAAAPAPAAAVGGLGRPPETLTPAEIDATAACLAPALDAAMARAEDATIRATRGWRPASRTYVASEHGYFLQVFANASAADYVRLAEAGPKLPQGAAVLKRSFRVAADGTASPGPIFVVERMAPGYDPAFADWRFAVTTPAGPRMGESGGRDADRVAFCGECHRAARAQDFLFFVPPRYRVGNSN